MQASVASPSRFTIRERLVDGTLGTLCRRLVAVDVDREPQLPLTVVPHGSFILALQTQDGRDARGRLRLDNLSAELFVLRGERGSYRPPGDCRTWFAQLTPEAGTLLARGQALAGDTQHVPLQHLLGDAALAELKDMLHSCVDGQLSQLGLWLERRLLPTRPRPLPPAARRAAHIASAMFHHPTTSIGDFARMYGVSRRQLERDFRRWLGTSPKRASLAARVQAAARMGLDGMRLADVAQALGFTDQAHLSLVTRQVTGSPPAALLRAARSEPNSLFSRSAGGDLFYLARAGGAIAQEMPQAC